MSEYSIALASANVAEGNGRSDAGLLTYTVTRTGDLSQSVSVGVDLGGTATDGVDYLSSGLFFGERLFFAANSATSSFTVRALTDTLNEPNETVVATLQNPWDFNGTPSGTIGAVGTVTGTFLNDDAVGDNTVLIPALDGTDRNDLITGSEVNNLISARAGNDTVYGGFGNDSLFGNEGSDLLLGNQGNDTIYGGQDADTIYGGQDIDELYGNLANDVMFGNLANDSMHGGQGNDTMHGGQDNDTINGGLGDDLLTGGVGSDAFVFAAASGNDVVTDFSRALGDTLDLGGQTYTLSSAIDGSAQLNLSGGGTIVLQGVEFSDFSADYFA